MKDFIYLFIYFMHGFLVVLLCSNWNNNIQMSPHAFHMIISFPDLTLESSATENGLGRDLEFC